jgi:hypothetical protein
VPGCGAGEVLTHKGESRGETSKKILRCGLQQIVELKPEPPPKRLRNNIG